MAFCGLTGIWTGGRGDTANSLVASLRFGRLVGLQATEVVGGVGKLT